MRRKVILCRGIGEPTVGGMLTAVADLLEGFDVVVTPYFPEYGFVGGPPLGQPFMSTLAQGQRLLLEELDKGPAIVIGYSAGAAIAGHVAALGHPNLVAVALLADPFQPQGVYGSRLDRFGIAHGRPISSNVSQVNGRVRWFFDPADVICQCGLNSPMRTLADQTRWMSLADPMKWLTGVLEDLKAKRFQAVRVNWLNIPATLRQYQAAADEARGYLPEPFGRGDHTSYDHRRMANGRTYVENMANYVTNAWAQFAPK